MNRDQTPPSSAEPGWEAGRDSARRRRTVRRGGVRGEPGDGPRNADALLRQAKKASEEWNTKEAQKLFVDYLNFQPKDADALGAYAQFLESTGRGPKATRLQAETYERLLRIDPDRRGDRLKIVKLYLALPFYVGAKDHVEYLLDPGRGARRTTRNC